MVDASSLASVESGPIELEVICADCNPSIFVAMSVSTGRKCNTLHLVMAICNLDTPLKIFDRYPPDKTTDRGRVNSLPSSDAILILKSRITTSRKKLSTGIMNALQLTSSTHICLEKRNTQVFVVQTACQRDISKNA